MKRAFGLPFAALVSSALWLGGELHAQGSRHLGDALSYALPAATLAAELARGDREGAWQFATSLTLTLAATEVLKQSIRAERPDGLDDDSFPSGHAARAFSAATYVHRRHGFGYAAPMYLAASWVGHTRVQADRHRWGDVVASAAIAGAATWWLVDPARPAPAVAIVPVIERRYVGAELRASW